MHAIANQPSSISGNCTLQRSGTLVNPRAVVFLALPGPKPAWIVAAAASLCKRSPDCVRGYAVPGFAKQLCA